MWQVSINEVRTTIYQKTQIEGIYGNDYFPRKFAYKKEAMACKAAAELGCGATMKVEKTS